MPCNNPFLNQKTDAITNPTNRQRALALLLSALHSYMWALADEALENALKETPFLLKYNSECLITCRYACVGKSDGRCILQTLPKTSEDKVVKDAVTLGQTLNVERKATC